MSFVVIFVGWFFLWISVGSFVGGLSGYLTAGPGGAHGGIATGGLPPEKWSSLMYGLWPDGGLKNAKEETHG
jgi:hypothetical protein